MFYEEREREIDSVEAQPSCLLCTYAADTLHFQVILPLIARRRLPFQLGLRLLDGLLTHQMLGGYIQIRLIFVRQHLVHLIADVTAQKVLRHMEVSMLAVPHPHAIIHRLSCLLIIFGLLDARQVGVEVLKLASFAVLQWNECQMKTLRKISQTAVEIGWPENEGMAKNETYNSQNRSDRSF